MPPSPAPLTPLLVVTTGGLPGTVRPVMGLLLGMEELVSEWNPVTDCRSLTYLLRHAGVLASHSDPDVQWDHESLFYPPKVEEPRTRRIAGFPSPAPHLVGSLDGSFLWQTMFRANWGAYCERLQLKPQQRYYVEPSSAWLAEGLAQGELTHRVLTIARDPRSELAEQWMQGRRRGALPEVLFHVDTPLSFAERQATAAVRRRLAELAAIQPDERQLCVGYEEFIERPASAWDRLRDWLELPPMAFPPLTPTGHEWPRARWQAVLPDSVSAHFKNRMGRELEALGYGT